MRYGSLCVLVLSASALYATNGTGAFSVRDFGATGDGKANDRLAIQKALDACSKAGGGTVVLPAGDYRSGTIVLRSNTTLFLQPGAVLQAIEDAEELQALGNSPRRHLIVANSARNVAIRGGGTIRGTGADDYGWRWGVPMKRPFRSGLVQLTDCEHVVVEDVTLEFSESFTLVLDRCKSVVIHGITINNNLHHENTDGIDIFSCQDVSISDSRIFAGDDAIVLKTAQDLPCERILVSNCILKTTCSGLKFGTGTRGDFRDIHFSNISIGHGEQGIAFFMKDGGTIENITFDSVSISYAFSPTKYPKLADARKDPIVRPILDDKSATFKDYNIWLNIEDTPILIDLNKRTADTPYGRIRDVSFSNINIRSRSGIVIQGRKERPIENLRMRGIVFRTDEVVDYESRHIAPGGSQQFHDEMDTLYARKPSYFTVAHVDGLDLDGYELMLSPEAFRKFDRTGLDVYNCSRARIRGVYRQQHGQSGLPAVRFTNSKLVAEDSKP